jgi:hypothetical protein
MPLEPADSAALAKAAFDFAVATFILAIIATFILQALHELFLRRIINAALVNRWSARRTPKRGKIAPALLPSRSAFNLPYRQLCGQFAAMVNLDIASGAETGLVRALAGSPGAGEAKVENGTSNTARLQAIGFQAEKAIDELQEYLGTNWIRLNYIFALAIIAAIVAVLIYTPNPFNPKFGTTLDPLEVMLIAVGMVASLIVPIGQRLLEPLIATR